MSLYHKLIIQVTSECMRQWSSAWDILISYIDQKVPSFMQILSSQSSFHQNSDHGLSWNQVWNYMLLWSELYDIQAIHIR